MQFKSVKKTHELKDIKIPSMSKCGSKDAKGISDSHLLLHNNIPLTA